jgi:exo-1,4-beta-D-glucosaminidase
LRPGGGYFGTKKANEPLHVQYSYDDQSVVVVNSYYRAFNACKVTAKVYDLDLREKFSKVATLDVPPDSSTKVLTLPQLDDLTRTYFVKLTLEDSPAKIVSSNFYWLSTQPDVSKWSKGNGRYTPIQTYADLMDLENLPAAEVTLVSHTTERGNDEVVRVTVGNPTPHLAFFVHLTVRKGKDGDDVKPIYWDDNYFPLMPGETREVGAAYPRKLMGRTKVNVCVDGWNVKSQSQNIGPRMNANKRRE